MLKRHLAVLAVTGCFSLSLVPLAWGADASLPAGVAAAIADASRPEADRQRDANRKPGELIVFAGIKAGDKVVDLLPGSGYFTRIFAGVVGPSGHVYSLTPREDANLKAWAAERRNVTYAVQPMDQLEVPEPVDVVWTSLNYHDVVNRGGADALNAFAFKALKPGGTYIVIDHAAGPNPAPDVTSKLHRIDPQVVKQQVQAAGFELEAESDVLRNPDDTYTTGVHDPSIRGRTDQFVLRFRKPAR